MAKKEEKQNKTIRSAYYLHQISPIIGYSVVLASVLIGKSLIGEYYPVTSTRTLDTYKTSITTMKSTVTSLNSQKQSNLQEKQQLETVITELKSKKEADGSLRFYTINLPAYGRYVEFRANASNVEIVDVEINESENTIDYIVLGDYNALVSFFNTLETREIYYVENFELMPSFNNTGSYAKFTANFNLDATITQRYEKKIKFESQDKSTDEPSLSETLNIVPEDEAIGKIDVQSEAPDDTLNTGKYKENQSTEQKSTDTSTTPSVQETPTTDTVVVEPIN